MENDNSELAKIKKDYSRLQELLFDAQNERDIYKELLDKLIEKILERVGND